MDKTELMELLKSFKTEIVALLPKKEEPITKSAIEAPTFEGDPTNVNDLETFQKSLQGYELRKAMAEGKLTAAQVADMVKSLNDVAPSDTEAGIEKSDTTEVKLLKRKLFKAQKRTNAPENGSRSNADEGGEEELRKSNVNEGLEIGKVLAARRGFSVK